MGQLPRKASPRAIAQIHYDSVVSNDKNLWLKTLTANNKKLSDTKGSSPYFWWETGRKYAEKYGVYYTFLRVAEESERRVKLFFTRHNKDGSQRGMPVPITLVLENGEWRVDQASY